MKDLSAKEKMIVSYGGKKLKAFLNDGHRVKCIIAMPRNLDFQSAEPLVQTYGRTGQRTTELTRDWPKENYHPLRSPVMGQFYMCIGPSKRERRREARVCSNRRTDGLTQPVL